MPTAESAAFLAKKPTVAPTYDGVDFEDNVAIHNARDAIIREQWVRSMMARLVGEELGKCYAREGVNHLEKCGVYRGGLFSLFSTPVYATYPKVLRGFSSERIGFELIEGYVDWLWL